MNSSILYLIPTAIGSHDHPNPMVIDVLDKIEVFICERIRTTRRWLKSILPDFDIDACLFLEFDKHQGTFPQAEIIQCWSEGKIIGLTSEAGSPAIADPGFQVVAWAHQNQIPVCPLSGSNSLILTLMGSGLNGNQFMYHGYFPIHPQELQGKINEVLKFIRQGYTQVFIETPYRNGKTFQQLLSLLPSEIQICIGYDLLNTEKYTQSKTVKEWQTTKLPNFHKLPCVFVLGRV